MGWRIGVLAILLGCGSSAPIELPVGHLAVDAVPDLGTVDCGGSKSFAVTVRNDRAGSRVRWSASVDAPFAVVGPSSGALGGGESTTLSLQVTTPATAVARASLQATLRFATNDPEAPELVVPLSVAARGAMLRLSSFPIELGDVPLYETSPDLELELINDGDAIAEFLPTGPSSSQFVLTNTPYVANPGVAEIARVRFAPTKLGDQNGTLSFPLKGPQCGPSTIQLHGKGTNGKALVSPGSLDFGLVDCGTTAAAKLVVVENTGDAAFDVDAKLTIAANFTVTPSHATVTPNATVLLSITPSPIPSASPVTSDLYGDTLIVTTTALGDGPHVIPIHETARGAILGVTLPQQPIRVRVDDPLSKTVTVTNTGNALATGTMTTVNSTLSLPAINVPPGGSISATLAVQADPKKLGFDDTETLAWNISGPLCGTTTGTIRAYDTVIDGTSTTDVTCALGHSHRVYCWGDNTGSLGWIPLAPLVYATPQLIVGELADRLGFGYANEELWLHSDGGGIRRLTWVNGVTTTTLVPFPGPFVSIHRSAEMTNHGWCGLDALGAVKCRANEVNGRWADGGPCANSGSDTAFSSLWPVDGVALGPYRGYAIKGGDVWWSLPCTQGPAPLPVKVAALSNVAAIVGDGVNQACARRIDGSVTCWSEFPWPDETVPVLKPVALTDATDILARDNTGWAARTDGSIVYWVLGGTSAVFPTTGLTFPVKLLRYASHLVCGVRADGALLCAKEQVNGVVFEVVAGFEGP